MKALRHSQLHILSWVSFIEWPRLTGYQWAPSSSSPEANLIIYPEASDGGLLLLDGFKKNQPGFVFQNTELVENGLSNRFLGLIDKMGSHKYIMASNDK